MAAHKKLFVRNTYGYKAREEINLAAKEEAEKEGVTLSSKIERLLYDFVKSKRKKFKINLEN